MNSHDRRIFLRFLKRMPKQYYKQPLKSKATNYNNVTAYIRVHNDVCDMLCVNDETGEIQLGSGTVNSNTNESLDAYVFINNVQTSFTSNKKLLQESSEREFLTAAGLL